MPSTLSPTNPTSVDPHQPLIDLLSSHNFPPLWLHSYLLNRSQSVSLNGSSSASQSALSGVPQGSILCNISDSSVDRVYFFKYCSLVWSLSSPILSSKLDFVQSFALKLASKFNSDFIPSIIYRFKSLLLSQNL